VAALRILTVCTGNVCRSPLVELLLRERLAGLGIAGGVEVASAGTAARPGQAMTEEMAQVAIARGIPEADARAHRARRLDEPALAAADLVLALTREHRSAAVQLAPRALRRSFTLTEFARLAEATGADAAGAALGPAELFAELAAARAESRPAAPEDDDVPDPIGLPQEVYDQVGAEIATAVDAVAAALSTLRSAAA